MSVVSNRQHSSTSGSTSAQMSGPSRSPTSKGYDAASMCTPATSAQAQTPRLRIMSATPGRDGPQQSDDVELLGGQAEHRLGGVGHPQLLGQGVVVPDEGQRQPRLVGVQLDQHTGAGLEIGEVDLADRRQDAEELAGGGAQGCEQDVAALGRAGNS